MKKAFWATIFVLALVVGLAIWKTEAQNPPYGQQLPRVLDAAAYKTWTAVLATSVASGSNTVTICPAYVQSTTGRFFTPFATNIAITVDPNVSAVRETVTPTAVALVTAPAAFASPQGQCANVTATFSNAHTPASTTLGGATQVISGDSGLGEAAVDLSVAGNGMVMPAFSTGSITPVATAAAIGVAFQTFTVNGLATTNNLSIAGQPAPTALCPLVSARVSAANTVQLGWAVLTAAACTPASGTYTFIATL